MFQFTPVVRRATLHRLHRLRPARGFNSRPSCDGRPICGEDGARAPEFQFTPVVRRATRGTRMEAPGRHVSIHARRATGDILTFFSYRVNTVSIHARRATGD